MIRQPEPVSTNRRHNAGHSAPQPAPHPLHEIFRKFAHGVSFAAGSPWAFALAVLVIVVWACMGPIFGFSDTWQLVINTATTIVTFLIVFLIQNTQNRDARAIHLKLDELIRGLKGARNQLVDLEELTDEELDQLEIEFRRIREKYSHRHAERQSAPVTAHEHVRAIPNPPDRRD